MTQSAASAPIQSLFGDLVVFRRREGPPMPLPAGPPLASLLRRAALAVCDGPIPEILSGHRLDGTPTTQPHVAFVALPDVGHPHADGHLLGLAAVLPRDLGGADRRRVLRALGRIERLTLGRAGIWVVERVGAELPLQGLDPVAWTRPSLRWATVTPVVLDGFPSEPYGIEAEVVVATACQRIGLPRPAHVLLTPGPVVHGGLPWHAFFPRQRDGQARRPHVHAVITFTEPVRGPVLLGAGRYRGLGLCRPIPSGRALLSKLHAKSEEELTQRHGSAPPRAAVALPA
jgi:CRISPR-associated protein Csb2